MEPQVLQQLIEAIQQLNNRITHLDGDISNMNNRLNTLSNDTRRSTASLESLTNETKKHRSGNRETQVNDATQALINAAKNIVLESTAAAHKTSGDHGIRVRARNRADRIGENYEEALKNRLDMFINAWGRDHRNSQVAYHEEEGIRNILRDLTEDIGNAVGTLRNELENSRSLLNVGGRARDHVIINMDKDYRESINNRGEKEYITISSVFSQAREDVKKLSNDIIQLSNDIKQTQDTVKLTNDVVLDLATNSDAVNKIMLDMNVNMEMANDNLRIFNMLLTSAGNAQWQQETNIRNNIQVMGQMRSMMRQMNATMHQLTNANTAALQNLRNTLNDNGTSNSGSANTFQQQATRNSDRAKQAGFIALLIPALAKLLQKTPITDFLRYLALKLGSGLSGKGEHPVLGTVGLGLASIIPTAAASKWIAKTLFGKGGGNVIGSARGRLPLNQIDKYAKGIVQGATSTPLDRLGANVDRVSLGAGKWATDNMGNYVFDKAGNRILTHQTGNVAGGLGYEAGRKFARRLPRVMKVGIGRAAQRIPILGTAVSAAFEIPDLIRAHKSGDKRLMGAQVAKSVGGVTGGTVGAIAGGTLGSLLGPIGTVVGGAVGGVLGDFVGRHLGSFFRTIFTGQKEGNKLFNTFGETMMEMAGLQAEEHPILTKILDIINPIPNLVLWIYNKIKGWTFGGESESNGGAAKDKADKESDKLVEDIAKKNKELEELTKVDGKEYNKLWKKYHQQYEGALKRKNGLYFSDEDREALKYESADKYALAKIAAKIKEKKHELAVSKSNLSNAVNIDKDQLVNANDLYTWSKSKVEEELKKRTGAYEKLNDKKGYWTVNHGSFVTDVEYAGKGTQNTLQRMVDDHVLPAGFSITSAMGSGEINKHTGKKGHSKNGGHYSPLGNAMDITYSDKRMWEVAMNGGVWNGVKYTGLNKAKGTYLKNVLDERAGKAGNKYARMGENTHLEFATTTLTDSVKAFQAEEKAKEQTATATQTKEETASSNTRSVLADIVGAKNKSDKQEKARNIIFSAVDVTGSLGVWGITQLNNGVMRTGR